MPVVTRPLFSQHFWMVLAVTEANDANIDDVPV